MWKNIAKGLRLSSKTGGCLQNESCISHRTSSSCRKLCISELIPGAFKNLNLCTQKIDHDQKYKQEDYERTSRTRPVAEHSFLEAFGWSGALVFAWVISKQWWFKYKWAHDTDRPWPVSQNNSARCQIFDKHFVQFLNLYVRTQPPVSYVLPQLKSNSVKDIPKLSETETLARDNDLDEFEAAAIRLQEVHERTIGASLNRRGIACLSKATGSEAITFFQRAAELKYPPASFNMGQCCELGIGTEQDFKKAAEWYRIASEQGHPTAKYNLGVFYAHGWGGLVADIAIAKQLFVEAAKLGQPDAITALDKESRTKKTTDCTSKVQPEICQHYGNITQLDKSEWNLLLKNLIFASSGDDAIKRTIDIIQSSVH